MRGLALLGLKTGDTIIVEAPSGGTEKLKLHKVYRRADKGEDHGTTYPSARTDAGSVLTFAGLRKPPLLRAMDGPAEFEDEDPGPFAA
jgi:hypothetical protein